MHQSGIKARNSLKEAESILERINENHVDLPGILTKSEIIQHYKALPQ